MKLEGLYYPQIVLLNETLLKYLLLVFDKITFLPNDIDLPPDHVTIRDRFSINDDILFAAFGSKEDCLLSGMYSSESRFWNDKMKHLMDTYDYLESCGICVSLNERTFSDARQWHPLKPFVDADVQNGSFVRYCESALNKKLTIAGDPQAEIKGGGFGVREFPYKGTEGFAALCSERINSALYFAGKQDLIPISNQDFFIQLLRLKLCYITTDEDYIKERAVRENRRRTILGLLSYEMITEAVPPGALDNKTMHQLLKYKTECSESQERFRNYLARVEGKLEDEPWDNHIGERIGRLVREEILPEIEKVREAKKLIWEKLFGETIKTVFSQKSLTPLIIASIFVFAPLPYLETLLYGTATALSGILPKLVDLAAEERERRRHALYYVANFK